MASMPLLGWPGVASARTAGPHFCAVHKAAKKCQGAGGATPGTGGAPDPMTITVSPNPVVETGQSQLVAVVEVETLPAFAGDDVSLSASQLEASCAKVQFSTARFGIAPQFGPAPISVALDDDGNATVTLLGFDCAPGTSVIDASMEQAPFLTALATLVVSPPVTTPSGLTGYPNQEVETGDTTGNDPSGDSNVYAVFYVETNAVYAEQRVVISSPQLEARCVRGWWWEAENGGTTVGQTPGGINTGGLPITTLDDDGNAVFAFWGASCAAGDSVVTADVLSGTHDTFTSTYTILPPAPTI
ncbi:MAG TPA: hypothetical protein VID75_15965 [Acidimicrobiales bacterium]